MFVCVCVLLKSYKVEVRIHGEIEMMYPNETCNSGACVENGMRDWDCCGLPQETACAKGFGKIPVSKVCYDAPMPRYHTCCVNEAVLNTLHIADMFFHPSISLNMVSIHNPRNPKVKISMSYYYLMSSVPQARALRA